MSRLLYRLLAPPQVNRNDHVTRFSSQQASLISNTSDCSPSVRHPQAARTSFSSRDTDNKGANLIVRIYRVGDHVTSLLLLIKRGSKLDQTSFLRDLRASSPHQAREQGIRPQRHLTCVLAPIIQRGSRDQTSKSESADLRMLAPLVKRGSKAIRPQRYLTCVLAPLIKQGSQGIRP